MWHSEIEKECHFNILQVLRVWKLQAIYTMCIKLLKPCDCLHRIANLPALQVDFSLILPL